MNFLMDAFTMENGRVIECMGKDVLSIEKVIFGIVNNQINEFVLNFLFHSKGEFVEGVFQSKLQKALKLEKMLKKKEDDILFKVLGFFPKFEQVFASSDKKTVKENLSQFFALQDEVKLHVQEPYPKYEEKKPDEWYFLLDIFNLNLEFYEGIKQLVC